MVPSLNNFYKKSKLSFDKTKWIVFFDLIVILKRVLYIDIWIMIKFILIFEIISKIFLLK
jgi:hypothetical protein